MKQLISVLIFCVFLQNLAQANEPLELTISEKSVYSFRFGLDNMRTLNNFFVKEIARHNYLNLYKTQYTLDFVLEVKIMEQQTGNYTVDSEISQRNMGGDIFYERFDLSEVLMPSGFDFEMTVKDGALQKTFAFSDFRTGGKNILEIENNLIFENPEFEISNVKFSYDANDKSLFEQRIIQINEYLAFFELLDYNLEKANQTNPDQQNDVLGNYLKIYDLNRFEEMLASKTSVLHIPDFYDETCQQNLKTLNSGLRRLNTVFVQNLDTLDFTFSKAEMIRASEIVLQLQINYLEEMKSSSHLYEPVYLEVMDFLGSAGDLEKMENALKQTFFAKPTEQNLTDIMLEFRQILYQAFLEAAEVFMNNEAFNEALLMLGSAETLCMRNPDMECELYTFHKLSQAKYGIYDSYMSVAASAEDANNPELAYKYLMLAKDFQNNNNNLIISSGAVDLSLENLAWRFLDAGQNNLKQGNEQEALTAYVNAQDIYRLVDVQAYNELIEKQITKILAKK